MLPLHNLSGNPDQDYFVEGTREALITDLAKVSALRVIARSSSMRYRGAEKSLPEIARELNVDAVLTGSVVRSGNRVRITAQLINAATEEHLWAERYERELSDVLSLQNEIVMAIAREIQLQLTPQEQARLASARQVNPAAHEAYLKGRFHWYKLSREELNTALECFQLALGKDPNYAPAYVGIADVWLEFGDAGFLPARGFAERSGMPATTSQNSWLGAMRFPMNRISAIVNGKRSISADTAMRLARYFGTSAQYWMNLQAAYDLAVAQQKLAARIGREVLPLHAA